MDAASAILQFNSADPAAWRERMLDADTASESVRTDAATREFEAILLRQYLSEALKPLTEGGSTFGGNNAVYSYLVTDSLARGLSESGVFGFSNLLQAQFAGANETSNDDTNDNL